MARVRQEVLINRKELAVIIYEWKCGTNITQVELDDRLGEEHYGDCTGAPLACVRCKAEDAFDLAGVLERVINNKMRDSLKES